jgi:ferredoxin/flavodoxin---NADP+ reductase
MESDMLIDEILAKGKSTLETVSAMRWWNEHLFTFTTTRPPGYAFSAGQYARLGLVEGGDVAWRAYSMTSGPADDQLEFYGIVVPNGLFTTRVKTLEPGDRILVEKQSYGFMTADRFTDGADLWMLATGTGIGPFLSILRDPYAWKLFERLILVHCVRHADEFAYREQLAAYERQAPDGARARLQVVRSTTRDQTADPSVLRGRITTLLENGELERAAGQTLAEQSSRIMLCGNPDMIEDTRKLLHGRGMRPVRRAHPGQFITENYW